MNKLLISFFLILTSFSIHCEESDSLKTSSEYELLILPFGFYTNETSLALGIFSQYRLNKSDNIFGNAFYTFKNQFMLFTITHKTFDKLIFNNITKVKDYYSDFYGVGNETLKANKTQYSFFLIDIYTETGMQILKNLNLFFALDNYYFKPEDEPIYYSLYSSKENQFATGLGFSFDYTDVTEEYFRDGISLKSTSLFYPDFFGNIGEFSLIDSEIGLYRSIDQSAVNLLFSSRFSFGHVHPEKLSSVGGTTILRGYPERRYVDSNMLSAQVQYDLRVYKNISACIFASAGDVFHDFSNLSIDNTKFGYGAGINYLYKKLIMRVEAAISIENDLEIIITGNRAF